MKVHVLVEYQHTPDGSLTTITTHSSIEHAEESVNSGTDYYIIYGSIVDSGDESVMLKQRAHT